MMNFWRVYTKLQELTILIRHQEKKNNGRKLLSFPHILKNSIGKYMEDEQRVG